MIAVDTNLLVYAQREDSHWHREAYACIATLAKGRQPWAVSWPCLHEFLAVVTHPRISQIRACARIQQSSRQLNHGE